MTTVEPKVTREDRAGGDEAEIETHPAYGQVSINRIQGRVKLYGSAIDHHDSFLVLKIYRSERGHSLSRDWHHPRGMLIEVAMSHAQFAEMITTPNMAEGIPCTIQRLAGKSVPGLAETVKTEARKISDGFKDGLSGLVASIRRAKNSIDNLLDTKKSISKGDRETIRRALSKILQEVELNTPFVLDQFHEAMEKTVLHSKAEVEAMIMTAVNKLGLDSLKDIGRALSAADQKRLGTGDEL